MTHREIVESAYRWVLNQGCGFAFKELRSIESECPDVIGFGSWNKSILIECKVSRSDFFADRKKSFRIDPEKGVGRFRFYCCPTDLIRVSDLPERWGLIYVSAAGKARCVHNPYNDRGGNIWSNGFDPNEKVERSYMYSALRRLYLRGRLDEIYQQQEK